MKLLEAKRLLETIIKTDLELFDTPNNENLTPMLWGGYGVGKTSIVNQIAKDLGLELIIMRLNTLSPVDVRGVPYADPIADITKFIPPSFIPKDQNKKYLIFFDEINTAPPLSQSVAYEIAHERTIGGHPLPKYCSVVLAGNRNKDNGVTFEMPMPLANRCAHIEVTPDIDSFNTHHLQKGVGLHSDILGFLNFKPTYLHADFIDGYEIEEIPATPSPRTWEMLSRVYNENASRELIESYVGKRVASDFIEYINYRSKLPDLRKILFDGETFKTNELQLQYFFVTSLFFLLEKEFKTPNESELSENGTKEKNIHILKNFIKAIDGLTDKNEIKAMTLNFLNKSSKSFQYNCIMKHEDMLQLYKIYKKIMGEI